MPSTLRNWLWSPEWLPVIAVVLLHTLTTFTGFPMWLLFLAQYSVLIVVALVAAYLIPDEDEAAMLAEMSPSIQGKLSRLVRIHYLVLMFSVVGIGVILTLGRGLFTDMYVTWSFFGGLVHCWSHSRGWAKVRRTLAELGKSDD